MFIKIISIGKLKEESFAKLAQTFLKRLSEWKVEVVELKEENSIELEAAAVAKHLPSNYFTIVLDVEGRELNSVEFSEFLEEMKDFKNGKICFVIGGAYGLPEDFKKTFDYRLSFGKLTFTHQFVKVLLLEQIYRAWTIMKGKKYHY